MWRFQNQMFCILKGDMSLIGPRPERECYYNEFEKYIHGFNQRLYVLVALIISESRELSDVADTIVAKGYGVADEHIAFTSTE